MMRHRCTVRSSRYKQADNRLRKAEPVGHQQTNDSHVRNSFICSMFTDGSPHSAPYRQD
ncbi:hypothetical protein NQZ68_025844 [Dissostichus eleginoides]|nr:hypothetical protein NQZ68_025844 [Dissostichus eleginoides]